MCVCAGLLAEFLDQTMFDLEWTLSGERSLSCYARVFSIYDRHANLITADTVESNQLTHGQFRLHQSAKVGCVVSLSGMSSWQGSDCDSMEARPRTPSPFVGPRRPRISNRFT